MKARLPANRRPPNGIDALANALIARLIRRLEATRPHRGQQPHADATKGAGEHTSPAPRVARYPSGYAWAASAATKAGAFGVPQPVVAS